MRIRTGTDIIEISRVKESIESTNKKFCERVYTEKERERIKESIENIGEKFLKRVFTDKEIEYCESKKAQKYQHYAARFSAKEAVFKAVSDELENKFQINWKDIEILNRTIMQMKIRRDTRRQ